ncbi:unnamed protein product [Urochloa humidicola]
MLRRPMRARRAGGRGRSPSSAAGRTTATHRAPWPSRHRTSGHEARRVDRAQYQIQARDIATAAARCSIELRWVHHLHALQRCLGPAQDRNLMLHQVASSTSCCQECVLQHFTECVVINKSANLEWKKELMLLIEDPADPVRLFVPR